jgi:2,5-diamino-6-(ribosylamino)-4(3H)-pyrimidinone 5'-phosphate reductase
MWQAERLTFSEKRRDRPYTILSAAMTLDGKIATKARDSRISCEEDLLRVHKLRAKVDAIMVGIETVLTDDPHLTVNRVKGKSPIRIVIDSNARTPLTARVLTRRGEEPTLIASARNAPKERVEALRSAGAEIIITESIGKVDLQSLMLSLHQKGIKRVMVEGGGNVNWSLLQNGLVDEVRVALAPMIVGGRDATTLVEGEGVNKIADGIRLALQRIERYGEDIVLTYKVLPKRLLDEARP